MSAKALSIAQTVQAVPIPPIRKTGTGLETLVKGLCSQLTTNACPGQKLQPVCWFLALDAAVDNDVTRRLRALNPRMTPRCAAWRGGFACSN